MLNGLPLTTVGTSLKGTVVNRRFKISDFVDKGSFGQVLKVKDLVCTSSKLAIKIMARYNDFKVETDAMRAIFAQATLFYQDYRPSYLGDEVDVPLPPVVASGFLFQSWQ